MSMLLGFLFLILSIWLRFRPQPDQDPEHSAATPKKLLREKIGVMVTNLQQKTFAEGRPD